MTGTTIRRLRRAATALLACALVASASAQEPPAASKPPALTVEVRTPDDAPLIGAQVETFALPPGQEDLFGDEVPEPVRVSSDRTDAKGVVRTQSSAPATLRVAARAPGRATAFRVVSVDPSAPRAIALRLAAECPLRGRVLQEGGEPVTDATVLAATAETYGDPRETIAVASTGSAGEYKLDGLPPGTIDLYARRPGSNLRWFARIALPEMRKYDFEFPRGGRVTGVVREAANGKPVPGALVRFSDNVDRWNGEGPADAGGRFSIWTYSARQRVSVFDAVAPGLALEDDRVKSIPPGGVYLESGGVVDIDFSLVPSARLDGRVTVENRPVAGATVEIRPQAWQLHYWRTRRATTDRNGAYALEFLDPGDASIAVTAAGLAHSSGASDVSVAIPGSGTARADVVMERSAKPVSADKAGPERPLTVRVLAPDGRPLAGATVTMSERWRSKPPDWPRGELGLTAVTGATGQVVLGGRGHAESWLVRARAPGLAAGEARVSDPAEGTAAAVDVRLTSPRVVSVRVVNGRTRAPVAGAWLCLLDEEHPHWQKLVQTPESESTVGSAARVGLSGSDGSCQLAIGPGAVRVHAGAERFFTGSAVIDADAQTGAVVVIALEPFIYLSGRFVHEEDGRPAGDVGFELLRADAKPGEVVCFGPFVARGDGSFEVGGLTAGERYEIQVIHWGVPDVAPQSAGPFRGGDGGVLVRVRPGRRFSGRVVDADGKGVDTAEILVVARPDRVGQIEAGHAETRGDGAFDVTGAPHGPIHVVVVAKHFGADDRERVRVVVGPVDPKPDAPLEVVLGRGLAIEGRLVRADGTPVPDMPLGAVTMSAGEGSAFSDPWNACRTDSDGRFRIRGLAEGAWRIWEVEDWTDGGFGHTSNPNCPMRPLDPETGTRAGTSGVVLIYR